MGYLAMKDFLSIGALARAVSVPPETLRTWERRYGFPVPTRLPSGHRRYPISTVPRLALIKRALATGLRASAVVPMDSRGLAELIGEAQGRVDGGDWVGQAMLAVHDMDAPRLDAVLCRAWDATGALACLSDVIAPLLVAMGRAWAAGEVGVAAEHLASDALVTFLRRRRTLLPPPPGARAVVCACLPGEQHTLGLHMVAVVAAFSAYDVRFFGADLPVPDIVAAATSGGALAVLTSVSSAYPKADAQAALISLRAALPATIQLLAGGAGCVDVAGVVRLSTLSGLRPVLAGL